MDLRGPGDVAITRSTRQCRRCEANQRDPLARGIARDVAHRLADHPEPQPMVLIEFRVEVTSVTGQDRGDPQARQPLSRPLHVASEDRSVSISNQSRTSEPCEVDYERVVVSPRFRKQSQSASSLRDPLPAERRCTGGTPTSSASRASSCWRTKGKSGQWPVSR